MVRCRAADGQFRRAIVSQLIINNYLVFSVLSCTLFNYPLIDSHFTPSNCNRDITFDVLRSIMIENVVASVYNGVTRIVLYYLKNKFFTRGLQKLFSNLRVLYIEFNLLV